MMQHMETPSESRISMRIDPERKAIILRAAQLRHTNLSAFMIENSYNLACEILADQPDIALPQKEIEYFFKTLDNPPMESVNAVRRLLSEPSILDE